MGNLYWVPPTLEHLLEHWKGVRSPTGFAKLVGSEPGAAGAKLTMCLALSYKLKILPPGRRLSKIKPRDGRVERWEHTEVFLRTPSST